MGTVPFIITDRKIRVAVIGCGRISQNHFASLEAHAEDFELTAVCDNNPSALAEAIKTHGVDGYSSLPELLKTANVDAVILCTPSGAHAEQAIQAATAGKHVITEKPMATKWQDGLAMVKACDAAERRLFVVKQNRRNSTLQLLKQAITDGRFGQIYMANLTVFWTRPQAYYDQASWRGTWEHDGGAFMNQASHYVDLLHWLLGPVEKIHAFMGTLARDIEAEDSGVLNIKWRNGALGSMSVTMLTYPKNLEGTITILGERGSVKIGGVAVNEIEQWEFADSQPQDATIKEANYATTSVYGLGHPLYYENIKRVLRGEAEPETDGREGLRSLELLIAAYRSQRDGTAIALPLEL